MRIVIIRRLLLFFFTVVATLVTSICFDIASEKKFIHAAKNLVGQYEDEVVSVHRRTYHREGPVAMIYRRRRLSLFWRLLNHDDGIVLYLPVFENKICDGIFVMWLPSMRIQEVPKDLVGKPN